MSYKNDKKGYVTFKGKKPKVKLRKYIADIADTLSMVNKLSISINKENLITAYDKDGLKAVADHFNAEVKKHLKKCTPRVESEA